MRPSDRKLPLLWQQEACLPLPEPPNPSLSFCPQSHPLYLCNASDDDNLEPGFVSIVKLESPRRAPRPCLSLASKVAPPLAPTHSELPPALGCERSCAHRLLVSRE